MMSGMRIKICLEGVCMKCYSGSCTGCTHSVLVLTSPPTLFINSCPLLTCFILFLLVVPFSGCGGVWLLTL